MIFDPLPKKIDKEIRVGTATKESGKRTAHSKPGSSICWPPKSDHPLLCSADKHLVVADAPQTQEPTRAAANHKKLSGTSSEVSDIKRKLQNDSEVGVKTEQERKIWENKYGKSVGQKLLSFIEKQPEAYQIPTPKHALPSKRWAISVF